MEVTNWYVFLVKLKQFYKKNNIFIWFQCLCFQKIKLIPDQISKSTVNWDNLEDFDKLLLMKTLQEEKLVFAINEFVKIKLGQAFIESPQMSLNVL